LGLNIIKYHPHNAVAWDHFIATSINGTFLLYRNFMDYHKDRFNDHSLMIYEGGLLLCCIPAHKVGSDFISHGGLSYGGFIISLDGKNKMEQIISVVMRYLKSHAFAKAEFQQPPVSYHIVNREIELLLQQQGFNANRVLHNQIVRLDKEIKVSSKKTRGYRNGNFVGLKIVRNDNFKNFWQDILVPQLKARYGSKPVHTLDEIELLASRFPKNIVQYSVYLKDNLLAGITLFKKNKHIRAQYTASSPLGLQCDATTFLYIEAMQEFANDGFLILDYGSVNEKNGAINQGLRRFKQELGCREEEWLRWEKKC
jgi:hypothetical protein